MSPKIVKKNVNLFIYSLRHLFESSVRASTYLPKLKTANL